MNKTVKLSILFLLLIELFSCSRWDKEKDRFVNTYRDILAIRMMITETTKANRKVEIILKRNGYTKESFKKQYFQYSADHDLFREMLDSAQIRARRDVQKYKYQLPQDE